MMEKSKLKVGVYQSLALADCPPEARLAALDRALGTSASAPELIVCPELFLSGYGAGEQHHMLAEPVDGPFSRAVAALAKKHGCCIVYGYPEAAGGAVYNSAVAIGADGTCLANHRKTVFPNAYERTLFAPGDRFTSFLLGDWKVALVVCCEVELPELVRANARQGADLIAVPTALTANWGVVAHQVVPTRAFENSVFLAYANHAGTEHERAFLGASCIVAPDGGILARAGEAEQVIEAELDSAALQAARTVLPYLTDCGRAAELHA